MSNLIFKWILSNNDFTRTLQKLKHFYGKKKARNEKYINLQIFKMILMQKTNETEK